jgi:hypothetical protein
MKGHTQLLSGVLFHIVWAAGLFGLPTTVYAQHSLPEFTLPPPHKGAVPPTIDQLKVKNVVMKIMELAKGGELDPERLSAAVLASLQSSNLTASRKFLPGWRESAGAARASR